MSKAANIIKSCCSGEKDTVILLYVFQLLVFVLPILQIIGGLIAYLNTNNKNKLLDSHYRFIFCTFWLSWLIVATMFISAFALSMMFIFSKFSGPVMFFVVLIKLSLISLLAIWYLYRV